MNAIIHRMVIPAVVACSGPAAMAATYLTVEQAQQAIFPGATLEACPLTLDASQRKLVEDRSGVRVRNLKLQVWRARDGSGWLVIDEVVGKHDFITFAVGIGGDGAVRQVEVMDYRETYGDEVRNPKWRSQFAGKTSRDKLRLDEDIRNISGATLSCRHLADGVRRILATYECCLRRD